ncbi:MAG: hypothetical protein HeimC2_46170 [Candidatus Heimdallarchaeota archaeon LC_2]|nr:MAG: hypothetical protein HeimC2_46170 [Candidatus Heimdallarchaeota archaeon LC_2]
MNVDILILIFWCFLFLVIKNYQNDKIHRHQRPIFAFVLTNVLISILESISTDNFLDPGVKFIFIFLLTVAISLADTRTKTPVGIDPLTIDFIIDDHAYLFQMGFYEIANKKHHSLVKLPILKLRPEGDIDYHRYTIRLRNDLIDLLENIRTEFPKLHVGIVEIPYKDSRYAKFYIYIYKIIEVELDLQSEADYDLYLNFRKKAFARYFSDIESFELKNEHYERIQIGRFNEKQIRELFKLHKNTKTLTLNAGEIENLFFSLTIGKFQKKRTITPFELGIYEFEIYEEIIAKAHRLPDLFKIQGKYCIGKDPRHNNIWIDEPQDLFVSGSIYDLNKVCKFPFIKKRIYVVDSNEKMELIQDEDSKYLLINDETHFVPILNYWLADIEIMISTLRMWATVLQKKIRHNQINTLINKITDFYIKYKILPETSENVGSTNLNLINFLDSDFYQDFDEDLWYEVKTIYGEIFSSKIFNNPSLSSPKQPMVLNNMTNNSYTLNITGMSECEKRAIVLFLLVLTDQRRSIDHPWIIISLDVNINETIEKINKDLNLYKTIVHVPHLSSVYNWIDNSELKILNKDTTSSEILKRYGLENLKGRDDLLICSENSYNTIFRLNI